MCKTNDQVGRTDAFPLRMISHLLLLPKRERDELYLYMTNANVMRFMANGIQMFQKHFSDPTFLHKFLTIVIWEEVRFPFFHRFMLSPKHAVKQFNYGYEKRAELN